MDIFTMVITACIAGQPSCTPARFSDPSFVSEEACYARMPVYTHQMTKRLALDPQMKGKLVTYDVSCMNQDQLEAKLGARQRDL